MTSTAVGAFVLRDLAEAATWTAATNVRLIRLYEKHGYAVSERAPHDGTTMVRLTKALDGRRPADAPGRDQGAASP